MDQKASTGRAFMLLQCANNYLASVILARFGVKGIIRF